LTSKSITSRVRSAGRGPLPRAASFPSSEHPEVVVQKTVVDFPVFDADNHLYETVDAFTRFLPAEYGGLIKYVQVNGRDKIAVKGVISEYIPNPTFGVVARPGAWEEYFKHGNPEGKSTR